LFSIQPNRMNSMKGVLSKMNVSLNETVNYTLNFDIPIVLNTYIGKEIELVFNSIIYCVSCGDIMKKSFNQGFCYDCFRKAPEASDCVIRPELCKGHLGQGRDVEWEEKNHNQPHTVYLALTDCVKVGVTRSSQVPTRWIDQGAYQAIRFAETPNRYTAGVMEVTLKSFFIDKTNWRKMLRNENDLSIDLVEEKWAIEEQLPNDMRELLCEDDTITTIHYPVLSYPSKIESLSFDKTPVIKGKLMGIKGQYLLFDNDRVINIRKHSGYEIELIASL
jgi:hypothetical protein